MSWRPGQRMRWGEFGRPGICLEISGTWNQIGRPLGAKDPYELIVNVPGNVSFVGSVSSA